MLTRMGLAWVPSIITAPSYELFVGSFPTWKVIMPSVGIGRNLKRPVTKLVLFTWKEGRVPCTVTRFSIQLKKLCREAPCF